MSPTIERSVEAARVAPAMPERDQGTPWAAIATALGAGVIQALAHRPRPRNGRERAMQSLTKIGATAAWSYLLVIRPWHLRWGATDAEVRRPLPGDDQVPRPYLDSTRAVTIDAPVSAVWPWLVQMGYHRAGWYSYDLIDNDGIPSDERIVPELQHLKVGDIMPTGAAGGFRVAALEPERSLVLTIEEWRVLLSAAFLLVPIDEQHTRLIHRLRVRFALRSPWYLYYLLFEPGDFLMVRKMLLGIKRRAERLWVRQRTDDHRPGPLVIADGPRLPAPPLTDFDPAVSRGRKALATR